ncbi:MAG TPA: hypothetical protein VF747_08115 [Blastocatellia bacterium]|jgi:hypothetical protein
MKSLKVTLQDTDTLRARSDARAGIIVFLLCAALSATAVIPFFFIAQPSPGHSASELRMPVTHDMGLHYDQMRSFYKGLEAGKLYPRWEEDTNRGFGAPTSSYYPPAIYYVTSMMYFMCKDWAWALMWAMLLIMGASGWAIYLYASSVMSRGAAVVVMCVYMLLPYHLVDQYQRGAIAELLGFVWMPSMLWSGERLMGRGDKRRKVVGMAVLAMSYGGYVWSHPPTAYQFSLGYGVYMGLMGVMRREWKGMMRVAAAMVIGLGISAAYLLPAALEQDLIRSDHIAQQYPYHDSYVLLFLRPNPDHYYAYLHLVDRMWIFSALVILVAAITLLVFKPRPSRDTQGLSQRVLLWVILGGGASFMMTAVSKPIGLLLPKIEIGVFAWRMLSIVTLAGALLAGACAERARNAMKQGRRREFALQGMAALLIVSGAVVFSWEEVVKPCYDSPVFAQSPEHLNLAMQPRSSEADIFKLPTVEPAVLALGKGSVSIERWEPERRSLRVELSEPDRLLIRTFNFPGWTAAIDGKTAPITAGRTLDAGEKPGTVAGETQLGDICIELPPGAHRVTLDYGDTPIRRAAEIITLSSLFVLMALFLSRLALSVRH